MKWDEITSVPVGRILAYLRQRGGLRRGQRLGNVPYYLMSVILEHHDFDSLDSLIVFCENRDNLRRWVPSEGDRIVFSDQLVRRLREMPSNPSTGLDVPAEMEQPLSPTPCGF